MPPTVNVAWAGMALKESVALIRGFLLRAP